ncbi:MAG: CBM9 family sugar-binding protein [Oscillospiraceae bacterium]|jgi:hypothetical protein|nr:CBM9 family sugar-binding protein [Oscillospiraceae bacterium]
MFKAVKFTAIFLLFALMLSLGVAAEAKPTVEVKRGSAKIDGQIDDIWQYVEEMKLDRVNDGEKTDAVVYAKMLWDDDNLYILMVALDNTKFNTDEFLSQEDCFEVMLDLENKKTDSYSEPNQFRFLYDILTPLETGMRFLENISEDAWQHIEIAGVETDTGYIMEARINSKVGIDFTLKENMEIGIDFGYDDNTEGEGARAGQLTWNADGTDNVANVPLAMGTIKLVNEEAQPPTIEEEPEPAEEAAAQTEPPAQAAPELPENAADSAAPQTGDAAAFVICAILGFGGLGVKLAAKRKK